MQGEMPEEYQAEAAAGAAAQLQPFFRPQSKDVSSNSSIMAGPRPLQPWNASHEARGRIQDRSRGRWQHMVLWHRPRPRQRNRLVLSTVVPESRSGTVL